MLTHGISKIDSILILQMMKPLVELALDSLY